MKQTLVFAVKDDGKPILSATCTMYLPISDNVHSCLCRPFSGLLLWLLLLSDSAIEENRECCSKVLSPNYVDVEGAETLRSSYNYGGYLTTSDFKFVGSHSEATMPADQTLKKSLSVLWSETIYLYHGAV